MPTPVGVKAPRRQGAVSACTSGSDVAPLLMGGMYQSSPSSVADRYTAMTMKVHCWLVDPEQRRAHQTTRRTIVHGG
jgi:hypothetical protein